jgi:hypothetical protein
MNKICLAMITGAALMSTAGIANAQETGTNSGSSATVFNQCLDLTGTVCDKNETDKNQTNAANSSETSSNTSSTVGSTSSSNASSTVDSTSPINPIGNGIAHPGALPKMASRILATAATGADPIQLRIAALLGVVDDK